MGNEQTTTLVLLPDGSYGLVLHTLTYGEAVIILLLVALVFLKIYEVWRRF